MNEAIEQTDWSSVENADDVNDKCYLFYTILHALIKRFVPSKTFKNFRLNDKSWMTPEIRREIRKRDRIHKQLRTRNSDIAWNEFRTQRNPSHPTHPITKHPTQFHPGFWKKYH